MFKQARTILPCLGIAACLAIGDSAGAATIVHYDFENETGSTITDKAGPDYTHATRDTTRTSIVAFQGSQGLELTHSNAAPISLEQGANNELAGDFADGLVVEAVFTMDASQINRNQVIAARNRLSDTRSWIVNIFAPGVDNNNRGRVYLAVSGNGSDTDLVISPDTMRIEADKVYSIRAVFDPSKSEAERLEIILANLTDGGEVSATASTSLTKLYTSPDVVTYIGAQQASGGTPTNNFVGIIDDLRISTVPEPGSLMLGAVGAALVVGRRRRPM